VRSNGEKCSEDTRVTPVLIALIYLGLCALFKPIRMAFDFLAAWTAPAKPARGSVWMVEASYIIT
jgi:hypothetical protein